MPPMWGKGGLKLRVVAMEIRGDSVFPSTELWLLYVKFSALKNPQVYSFNLT